MRPLPLLFVLLSAVLAAGAASAADLPTATPEQVGLSSSRLARITETLKADVEAGRIPGAVVIVARKGRIAYAEAVGFRDKAAGQPDDDGFDLPDRLDDQADGVGRGDDALRGRPAVRQ